MGFVVDTCVWVDVERGLLSPAAVVELTANEPIFLSPVTIAELRYGAERAANASLRQKRLAALQQLRDKPILPIDGRTGEVFGALAAELSRHGATHRYRVQDLWIASQAIQHSYRLLTANKKDFEDLPGLDLLLLSSPRSPKKVPPRDQRS